MKFLTGIYVRVRLPSGSWANVDISELSGRDLVTWLRSRGGENAFAENLIGHGRIVADECHNPGGPTVLCFVGCCQGMCPICKKYFVTDRDNHDLHYTGPIEAIEGIAGKTDGVE